MPKLFKAATEEQIANRPHEDTIESVSNELRNHCVPLSYEMSQGYKVHGNMLYFPPNMKIVLQVPWEKLTTISPILMKFRDLSSEVTIELRMH